MGKKVILSAGGTGGHLFPAQNLAQALTDCEILFAAGGLRTNRYFDQTKFRFEEVESATFSFFKPLHVMKGSAKIFTGLAQSRKILKNFKPDLVVGFGSFFTLPVLLAALIEKIPFILHEQNTIPGKVNRFFSSYAVKTTITFPTTREFLKGRAKSEAAEVFFPSDETKRECGQEAWSYFNLSADKLTILVFGGSQGALKLNQLFFETIPKLPYVQVMHFTGTEERAIEAIGYYNRLGIPAYVRAFEPRMDLAMRIADLAITRAGAATTVELIENELPAILIPYPFAAENHQEKNGAHFVSIVKGGKMYKEGELDPSILAEAVQQLLSQLELLKKNMIAYKKQRQARHLADIIKEYINDK